MKDTDRKAADQLKKNIDATLMSLGYAIEAANNYALSFTITTPSVVIPKLMLIKIQCELAILANTIAERFP